MSYRSITRTRNGARKSSSRFAGMLGASLFLMVIAATAAFSQGDIMIRDCPGDVGNSPSTCGSVWYESPDIWARLANDWMTGNQIPIGGQPAYMYVRLTNRSNSEFKCGVVHLYYTTASIGWNVWPLYWFAHFVGSTIEGDEIGSVCVCGIKAGDKVVVMIPWANVPVLPGGSGDHHCVLARFVSDDDPMQVPETSSTQDNVLNNNNIAQKNLIYTDPANTSVPVVVFNGHRDDQQVQWTFDAQNNDNGKNAFDVSGFSVKLNLGPELHAMWNGQGDGVTDLPDENAVRITNPHARMDGINMAGKPCDDFANFTVTVEMDYPADIPQAEAANIYHWNMEQHEGGATTAVNGMGVDIAMSANAGGGAPKTLLHPTPTLGNGTSLDARPNIATATTTLSYMLPKDAAVTLAIYDANGNLVRTLLSKADTHSGSHEVEWDGKSSSGSVVPSGTYFYRLILPDGTVEKQLKIVR